MKASDIEMITGSIDGHPVSVSQGSVGGLRKPFSLSFLSGAAFNLHRAKAWVWSYHKKDTNGRPDPRMEGHDLAELIKNGGLHED